MEYIKYLTIILVAIYTITATSKSEPEDKQLPVGYTERASYRKNNEIIYNKIKMSQIQNKIYSNKQLISTLNGQKYESMKNSLRAQNQKLYNDYFDLQEKTLYKYQNE